MAESKTKSAAAKTLAKDSASKTQKKVAAKVLASDKPNQAVAEAAVQEAHSKARDLVEQVSHIDVPHIADEATELVADGAEAVAETFTTVAKVTRRISGRDISLVLGGMVIGVGIGGYLGFRVAEKKMRMRFDDLLEEETASIREHYRQKLIAHDGDTSKISVEDLAAFDATAQAKAETILAEQGYVPPGESATLSTEAQTPAQVMRDATETQEMRDVAEEGRRMVSAIEGRPDRSEEREQFQRETRNIFAQRDKAELPKWDYAVELKSRDPRLPYVIHEDEWRQNEKEYEQKDLTYYEGDNVLCDDADRQVTDIDERIGLESLNRFGHGAEDANVVFVCNEVSEVLYEVVRSHGSYALEVVGIDPNETDEGLRHSDRSWRGKQTFEDD